ncbi:MAG TPA: NAD(P)-dependent oxidoreductase [Tissierellaceae bacterium]
MKITILEPLAVEEEKLRKMAEYITKEGHELDIYNSKGKNDEELIERVKDTEILIIANSPLSGDVIRSAKKLKMIAVAFTGVDHVDLDACRERDIIVSNAAGYSTSSVAELAFGMMISIYRNLVPLDEVTRKGGTKDGYRQIDLYEKTLGIVGTGAIGSHVANIGLAFGCKVIAYNRSVNKDLQDKGVEFVSLEELLKISDIVTIHLPLNDSTKGLIGEKEIALMKEDSILINTARGPIVDNKALAKALKNKDILGAGIDVFDIEPPLNLDEELLDTDNTVLAPHIGFATEEAMVRRAEITFDNVDSFIKGSPKNLIK